MPLSSPQNPQIQKVRRAVETGRPLDNGAVAAEGPHLLEEALASAWQVEHVLFSTVALKRHHALVSRALGSSIQLTEVTEHAFNAISSTENNQGVLSLLKPRVYTWPHMLAANGPLVILDGIQDPGNAGAIIRSTEAFGGAGVVFAEGCVRVSNSKLLRAAAGSLFRLPFLENRPPAEILSQVAAGSRRIFSLSAGGRLSLAESNLKTPFALVVGSEGRGVSPAFLACSQTLSIPTRRVESLNAAIACSIALFEASRQSL